MMRIKLFGLFIAFALLALVRPRKCLDLLDAADDGVAAMKDPMIAHRLYKLREWTPGVPRQDQPPRPWPSAQVPPRLNPGPAGHVPPRPIPRSSAAAGDGFYLGPDGEYRNNDGTPFAHPFSAAGVTEMCTQPRCTLPPAGWRCTRRAGHDGPCAAVVK